TPHPPHIHTPSLHDALPIFSFRMSNNTIGGTSPADRNVISGNNRQGLYNRGGTNFIEGNFIGTNAAGTAALANDQGMELDDSVRSEEHTSELQSRENLVCRL